jgi:hypothetical protein
MLVEETGGAVRLPPLGAHGTAADLLSMARNNQLPGLTYTSINEALQNGQVKPGDVLIWEPNISADNSGHVAFVTAVNGSQVTVQQRDFPNPNAGVAFTNRATPGHWLDTKTFDLSQPTKIAGVLSPQ